MLKKLLLIGSFTLLAAASGRARIGYTLEQCAKEYGQPSQKTGNLVYWFPFKNASGVGTMITATFENKKVVRIEYTAESPENNPAAPGYFTISQIKDLYARNGGAPLKLQLFCGPAEKPVAEIFDAAQDRTIIDRIRISAAI